MATRPSLIGLAVAVERPYERPRLRSLDLDLVRPRLFAPLNVDLHDAVGIFTSRAPPRVDIFRQTGDPPDLAAEALLAIVIRLLLDSDVPLTRYREQILLYGNVEALGFDA